jgi:hypothetical protein
MSAKIFLTCHRDDERREPLYKSQITSLVSKFKGRTLFPESKGATHTLKTYQEHDEGVVTMGRGVIAVQYTPFQEMGGDDGCSPQARVRVYAQGDGEPVIEKTWDATSKQVSGKRRRDASCSQFPIVASIQGHFTNISQVWREIGLSRRTMSLSVTALPLAWVLASPVRALAV